MNAAADKTNTLTIRTPEGVSFSLLLAGPVTRFLAWLLDFFVVLVIYRIISGVVGTLGIIHEDIAVALNILAYFIVTIGYGMVLEWSWRGQTIGKKIFRLRVLDEQGLKLKFSQIAVRNLMRVVDSLPLFYMVGGLAMLINRRCQRLGDLAGSTIVVRHPQIQPPDLDQLLEGRFNSFHAYPHIEARLRQHVNPQEAGLAVHALLRRDELDPVARVELLHALADHFRSKAEFPPEAVEGLSDERYVRNVVEVVFRDSRS